MSHLVSIKTEVRDAVAVQAACQRLRLETARLSHLPHQRQHRRRPSPFAVDHDTRGAESPLFGAIDSCRRSVQLDAKAFASRLDNPCCTQ
jgi:hypothetical protein